MRKQRKRSKKRRGGEYDGVVVEDDSGDEYDNLNASFENPHEFDKKKHKPVKNMYNIMNPDEKKNI